MQQRPRLSQQIMQNQAVTCRAIEAIEPAARAIRSSDSLRQETDTLAAIREAALAQIAESERLAIAAVSARYEKRLRDLEGRAELRRPNAGPKFDLIVSQIRASTGSARSALRAEMLALYQPQVKIDAKIKQLLARRGDALDAARERYRVERRAIRRRVREAEKSEAARAEQERLDAIRRDAAARVGVQDARTDEIIDGLDARLVKLKVIRRALNTPKRKLSKS
jgi:hypothetical protein